MHINSSFTHNNHYYCVYNTFSTTATDIHTFYTGTKRMTGLLTIVRSDVPLYLRKGSRFQSLKEEEDSISDVPCNGLKADTTICSIQDFNQLLESLLFWGVNDEMFVLYDYILNQPSSEELDCAIGAAAVCFPLLAKLNDIKIKGSDDMVIEAIKEKEVDIVRYLDERGHKWPSNATSLAAQLGHLRILQYAAATDRTPGSAEIMLAVANGHVSCLKFIYELGGCRDKYRLVTECVRHGQLECLQYLHSVRLVDKEENLCAVAVTHRHLPILSYLLSIGCSIYEDCASLAACNGDLDILTYLRQHDCPWDSTLCDEAAARGHLHILTYAHEKGCFWDDEATSQAAEHGHLDCLMYLHTHGCPCNEGTVHAAALAGHLNCVQYFFEQGIKCDGMTCAAAAFKGHLPVLQYLHEAGCPWDEHTTRCALSAGHLDCLQYAHGLGCPVNVSGSIVWEMEVSEDAKHQCLQYLSSHIY